MHFVSAGILTYTSKETGVSEEAILGIDNFFMLADSNDPLYYESVLTNQFFGKVYFLCLSLGIQIGFHFYFLHKYCGANVLTVILINCRY